MNEMMKQLRPALVLLGLLTVITGILYPLAVTGAAQTLFPEKADGSLIERDGVLVGSELIGQQFDDPAYFWGRVSSTGGFPYNAAQSSGSNNGVLNPALIGEGGTIDRRASALREADPANADQPIPVDLVTSSASGLDPHISPAAVEYQIERVAAARNLDPDQVRALVEDYTQGRTFGILGEPRVNVLLLNLALDEQFGVPTQAD